MSDIKAIRHRSFNIGYAILCVALLGVVIPTASYALDQRTEVAFSGAVEVPGKVLQPGTYVFKVLDSPNNRNIVQVFDKSEKQLYATFMTVPDFGLKPSGKTAIGFEEPTAGSAMALSGLFFPGAAWGDHFVYPLNRATELAKKTNKNVFFMPTQLAVNLTMPANSPDAASVRMMRFVDIKVIKPSGEQVTVAEAIAP